MSSADIRFRDLEGAELGVDSYVHSTKRGDQKDYAFVLLTEDPGAKKLHTVGLTFEQAKNLVVFLVEELSK